jgi:hypothetical protein
VPWASPARPRPAESPDARAAIELSGSPGLSTNSVEFQPEGRDPGIRVPEKWLSETRIRDLRPSGGSGPKVVPGPHALDTVEHDSECSNVFSTGWTLLPARETRPAISAPSDAQQNLRKCCR